MRKILSSIVFGVALSCAAIGSASADSISHSGRASQHSAAAGSHGSAAVAKGAVSVVAVPVIVAGSALVAIGEAGAHVHNAGTDMWDDANAPLPLTANRHFHPIPDPVGLDPAPRLD